MVLGVPKLHTNQGRMAATARTSTKLLIVFGRSSNRRGTAKASQHIRILGNRDVHKQRQDIMLREVAMARAVATQGEAKAGIPAANLEVVTVVSP